MIPLVSGPFEDTEEDESSSDGCVQNAQED